ncbi:MAG: hypothetical protein MZV49_08580 [Rhodopseudomonas palustris]|nr:hypothetical protein [Rhodopseudomonas palustris]
MLFHERGWVEDAGRHLHAAAAQRNAAAGTAGRLWRDVGAQSVCAPSTRAARSSCDRLIFALGIRHIGEGNARLLARHFADLDSFLATMRIAAAAQTASGNASEAYQELLSIAGIGEIVAAAVVEFFAESRNMRRARRTAQGNRGAAGRAGQARQRRRRQNRGVHRRADKVHPR